MSAFIVSHEHIAAIVGTYCAMRNPHLDSSCPIEIAHTLFLENVRSYCTRYPDQTFTDEEKRADLKAFTRSMINAWEDAPLSIGQFLNAMACYEYQSCESDNWHDTEAFKTCERLKGTAIQLLPDYLTCPWGIDSRAPLKPVAIRPYESDRIAQFAAKVARGVAKRK